MKKRLSEHEEFEVMKMVLDKFLWLGTALLGWGLFVSIDRSVADGAYFITAGAVIMALFAWIMLKEFEFIRVR